MWALGLQAALGCLQPPCTTRSFHSWESGPEQVVSCKEGVKGYTCSFSGGRKLSSETQLPCGDLLWGDRECLGGRGITRQRRARVQGSWLRSTPSPPSPFCQVCVKLFRFFAAQ